MINKLIQDKLMRYIHTHFGFDIPMQAGMIFIEAFVGTFLLLFLFVKYYKHLFSNSNRPCTPETHKIKHKTPTMGGVFILLGSLIPLLLSTNIADPKIFLCMASLIGFGFIGLCDDVCKFFYKKGISAFSKFCLQLFCAVAIAWTMVFTYSFTQVIVFPFVPNFIISVDQNMMVAWIAFLLIACANAVNLTDGLDGLAVECLIPNLWTVLFLIVVSANAVFADYLGLVQQDIAILVLPIAALLGSLYAFLWFNTYPASIFMGDVGSLALGSVLAYLFLQTHYEFFLAITGILFVIETLSVIVQVCIFKLSKKRMFKMAPYHHHLEMSGMHEAQIVKRFSMISWCMFVCVIAAFLGHCFYIK
jgi:phospho-N-acetylmuramoyl-pentapeptide-transferase